MPYIPTGRRASALLALLTGVVLLSACASQDPKTVVDAVSSPLNDLNLVHPDVPAILAHAHAQPYAAPAALDCTALATELQELDAVLGPDIDAKVAGSDPNAVERGINQAKGAAVGALRTSAQSVIPFREWVRKFTGAEENAKKSEQAIAAGVLRRAFLKGIRVSKECA